MHHAVLPLIAARRPQAIMLQAGADALEEDPLAKLSLSNNAHWAAVAAVMRAGAASGRPRRRRLQPVHRRPLLGGDLGRAERLPYPRRACRRRRRRSCAACVYNRAAGRNPPEHWFTTLRDAPREGPVRDEIERLAAWP